MTRIDFYILPDDTEDQRLVFICRLVDKAQKLGHQVYVACENQNQASTLSDALWSFQPETFVAHDVEGTDNRRSKVMLGWSEDCGDHHEVMVNLKNQIPTFFSRFERLTEVVIQDEKTLQKTREHFSFYRDRGYPINTHDLRR